jgi:hypothetical protein
MASLIANEFSEASSDAHLLALMAVGFTLFVITIVVNALARWLVWRVGRSSGGRALPPAPCSSGRVRGSARCAIGRAADCCAAAR